MNKVLACQPTDPKGRNNVPEHRPSDYLVGVVLAFSGQAGGHLSLSTLSRPASGPESAPARASPDWCTIPIAPCNLSWLT